MKQLNAIVAKVDNAEKAVYDGDAAGSIETKFFVQILVHLRLEIV